MKKLSFSKLLLGLIFPLAIGFTACNDNDGKTDTIPTISFKDHADGSTISKEQGAFEQTVVLESNRNWEITVEGSWLGVTPQRGVGSASILLKADANTEEQARTATITAQITGLTTKVILRVSQAGTTGGGPSGDPLYKETVGQPGLSGADIKKDSPTGTDWPYVDQYKQWQTTGTLSQTDVKYTGSGASVRNSGRDYDPATGSVISGVPYVVVGNGNKYFEIEDINITGNDNFTLTFAAQITVSTLEATPYTPTFGDVTATTLKLSGSLDGTTFTEIPFTVARDGSSSWYIGTAEFKAIAGSTKLYLRFGDVPTEAGKTLRLDDFTLYAGGNGTVVVGEGGVTPGELVPITIAQLNAKITETETPVGNYKVKGIVVTDMAAGNYSSGGISIQDETATAAGNGILLYWYGATFKDENGNPLYAAGEELEIDLSGASLKAYKGAGADPDGPMVNELIIDNYDCITKTGRTVTLSPVAIQYDQLEAYQSMLVKIEGVQSLSDAISVWPANTTVFTVGNDEAKSFNVYVGKDATSIVGQPFLVGNGTIEGIAYVYGGSKSAKSASQLVPRTYANVTALTGERVGGIVAKFGVASESINVPAAGGDVTLGVTGNVAWTAEITEGNNYIESVAPTSGDGAASVIVKFNANSSTTDTRVAKVKVSTTNADITVKEIIVTFTQAKVSEGGGTTAVLDKEAILGNLAWISSNVYAESSGDITATDGTVWTCFKTTRPNDGKGLQMTNDKNAGYIMTPLMGGTITKVTVTATSASGKSRILKLFNGDTQIGTAGPITSAAGDGTQFVFDITGESGTQLKITSPDGALRISNITVEAE